jgi:plastocyanin
MRRFLVLALACGLTASLAQGAPAKTSRCRHKTRVHKHAQRRCRRHVRHAVTRTAAPPSTSGGTSSSPPAPEAPPPGPVSEQAPKSPPTVPRIQVSASEFYYTLSRSSVPAGKVIFEFVDSGQDEHNLNVGSAAGELELSFATAQPKAISDQAVVLKRGVYTLFCSLPEHESKGMKATLTVQ